MTKQKRAAVLWEILREDYGVETMEKFLEAYSRCPPIDISAFVEPGDHTFFPKRDILSLTNRHPRVQQKFNSIMKSSTILPDDTKQ